MSDDGDGLKRVYAQSGTPFRSLVAEGMLANAILTSKFVKEKAVDKARKAGKPIYDVYRLQADISTLMPKAAQANGHGARRSEKSIPGIMTF